MHGETVKVAF